MLLIEIAIRFAPNLKITRVEIGKNPEWKQTGKLDQVSFGNIKDFGKKTKKNQNIFSKLSTKQIGKKREKKNRRCRFGNRKCTICPKKRTA